MHLTKKFPTAQMYYQESEETPTEENMLKTSMSPPMRLMLIYKM